MSWKTQAMIMKLFTTDRSMFCYYSSMLLKMVACYIVLIKCVIWICFCTTGSTNIVDAVSLEIDSWSCKFYDATKDRCVCVCVCARACVCACACVQSVNDVTYILWSKHIKQLMLVMTSSSLKNKPEFYKTYYLLYKIASLPIL